MPNEAKPCLRVGLTGGIGSGKSVVAGMFARKGRTVLDADAMARELMVRRIEIREAILREFGAGSYHPDGSVNRPFLASQVFTHASRRRKLEHIVHPAVIAEILARIQGLPEEHRCPYVVVEAALIYESGFDRDLDSVVVVEAHEAVRVERVNRRDGLSPEEIRGRMQAQLPDQIKAQKADFLLRNNGSLDELQRAVDFVDRVLTAMVGQ